MEPTRPPYLPFKDGPGAGAGATADAGPPGGGHADAADQRVSDFRGVELLCEERDRLLATNRVLAGVNAMLTLDRDKIAEAVAGLTGPDETLPAVIVRLVSSAARAAGGPSSGVIDDLLAAGRAMERDECCADMCWACSLAAGRHERFLPATFGPARLRRGEWWHPMMTGGGWGPRCSAAPIRIRAAKAADAAERTNDDVESNDSGG